MSDPLGFLLTDVARLLRRRFDERVRALGVTRPQWRTLTTLSRHEGANQGTLADLLEVEPITLCRMIDRLEESGLVERRRDPADRRAWQIFLTDAARPMLDKLRAHADALIGHALAGLDTAEQQQFAAALELLRANLLLSESDQAAHG
ncbi:MarR family winged helix-turn-helix transcriptional regulator [Sphingomonas aracearum]|uniref:MarR family transcriptional regulator n=1 Tax=Sphingomonas aracearum TaxID=2283317 RepID=A0A369VV41_9SPHN|nr:MarR family transcriptional regulator [Sphingomonas aracearum]RDE06254.1 MarR family transcriptional regulator [Sphingomonas aracearum]